MHTLKLQNLLHKYQELTKSQSQVTIIKTLRAGVRHIRTSISA